MVGTALSRLCPPYVLHRSGVPDAAQRPWAMRCKAGTHASSQDNRGPRISSAPP